jgi:hypothetical protein
MSVVVNINDLQTDAERVAARKIVELLEPMTPKQRRTLIDRWQARENGRLAFQKFVKSQTENR